MSYRFAKPSKDANHDAIVKDLRRVGVCVVDLAASGGGLSDLVVWHNDKTVFLEIKFGEKSALKKTQVWFLGTWRGHCGIARTFQDAERMAKDPERYCLNNRQKERLLGYYATMSAKKVHLKTIENYLEGK